MATVVPFTQIVSGAKSNVRLADRKAGIPELCASILAHGILQPLLVRATDQDTFEVVDGNRRHAALSELVKTNKLAADFSVPIHQVNLADDPAREASLAANVVRVPLHAIDQYEAFAGLEEAGMTAAGIAGRFGITEIQVRRQLALGGLHQEIRKAWRAGEIDDRAAKAFTLARSTKIQAQVYKTLKEAGRLYGHHVQAALGSSHDVKEAIRVVGAEAYRKAGGQLTEDLFGDDVVVSDPELARKLLADRLQEECSRLVEAGWSFAVPADSVKDRWNWPRLTPSKKCKPSNEQQDRLDAIEIRMQEISDSKAPSSEDEMERLADEQEEVRSSVERAGWGPKQKASAGCLVEIRNGRIAITYGMQDPKVAKAAAKKKAGDDHQDDQSAEAAPKISNALHLALSEQRTIAVAQALEQDPPLALRALVAALETSFGPLRIQSQGYAALKPDKEPECDFDSALAELQSLSDEFVLQRLATVACRMLDLRSHSPSAKDNAVNLHSAIDRGVYTQQALEVFDPAAYFKGVNAELCKAALIEMVGENDCPGSKKAELVTHCAARAREHKWLPPELRHPSGLAANV